MIGLRYHDLPASGPRDQITRELRAIAKEREAMAWERKFRIAAQGVVVIAAIGSVVALAAIALRTGNSRPFSKTPRRDGGSIG